MLAGNFRTWNSKEWRMMFGSLIDLYMTYPESAIKAIRFRNNQYKSVFMQGFNFSVLLQKEKPYADDIKKTDLERGYINQLASKYNETIRAIEMILLDSEID